MPRSMTLPQQGANAAATAKATAPLQLGERRRWGGESMASSWPAVPLECRSGLIRSSPLVGACPNGLTVLGTSGLLTSSWAAPPPLGADLLPPLPLRQKRRPPLGATGAEASPTELFEPAKPI